MTDQIKKESESIDKLWHIISQDGADLSILSTGGIQLECDGHVIVLPTLRSWHEALKAKPEGWIAVSQDMPDEGRAVLIVVEGWVTMGWRHDGPSTRWTDWDGVELISPTHWRDLPAPPTQTDEQR